MANSAAFIVGIDDYERSPLECCVRDAADIAQVLEEPDYYGFKVDVCTNKQATASRVRRGLEDLLRSDAKVALFYFSGHGAVTDMGGYLLTHDYLALDDPGVSLDLLSKIIQVKAKPSTSVVVVLDCCHSGMARLRDSDGDLEILERPLDARSVAQPFKTAPGRVILAACRAEERALELAKEGHGVFTFHLLNGLLGEAANHEGNVTPTSLYEHVASAFAKTGFQTPVFSGDIAGKLVLGSGFPSTIRDIGSNELSLIERKAHDLVDEYLRETGQSTDDEAWRGWGFRDACARLETVLDWQRRKVAESKSLKGRPEFRRAMQRANVELSRLGTLYTAIQTQKGVIVDRLGSGTFGTVWKVETSPGVFLAYKVYNSQELEVEDKLTRFRRGYYAMKRLNHPQVVRVEDFTECPIGFYMAFIEGPNLREFVGIDQTPLQSLQRLLEIADTIRHAHGKGVVHRDVKPENILLRYDTEHDKWVPYLTDFDLAWFSAASRSTKVGLGAFAYAAPEQFAQPGAAISHAKTTDIYAFGQLAYFELMRSDPVPSGLEQNAAVLSERLQDWPSASAAEVFLRLYKHCSQPRPSDRLADFEQVWNELNAVYEALNLTCTLDALSRDDFLSQIKFEVVGLCEGDSSTASYNSRTGQARIAIFDGEPTDWGTHELCVSISVASGLRFTNTSHEKARALLSKRIDEMLKEFPDVHRTAGKTAPYECMIHIRLGSSLTYASAVRVAQVIKRVVDVLER